MNLTKEEMKEKYSLENNIILGCLYFLLFFRIITGFFIGKELGGDAIGILVMILSTILPIIFIIFISKYDSAAYIALVVISFFSLMNSTDGLLVDDTITILTSVVSIIVLLTMTILSLKMLEKKHDIKL